LHVNFTAPHDPRLTPKGYEAAYDPTRIALPKNFASDHPFDHGNQGGRDEVLLPRPLDEATVRDELATYYALIEHLDAQVGRIVDALANRGELQNTVIIYTSDHGLALGSHGLTGKQNMYEHTIGVPLVIAGPGVPRGSRLGAQCYLRDLYPTICQWCDVPVPAKLDGRELQPLLDGSSQEIYPFVVGYFTDTQRMIRDSRWKLIRYPQARRVQLFDLAADPDELHDLSTDAEQATTAAQLQRQLDDWLAVHGDPLASQPPGK
jgi:arylsulfatase A-like enzyme